MYCSTDILLRTNSKYYKIRVWIRHPQPSQLPFLDIYRNGIWLVAEALAYQCMHACMSLIHDAILDTRLPPVLGQQ